MNAPQQSAPSGQKAMATDRQIQKEGSSERGWESGKLNLVVVVDFVAAVLSALATKHSREKYQKNTQQTQQSVCRNAATAHSDRLSNTLDWQ